eukprot:742942-Prorocentrum_minimum.AAC.1
MKKARVQCPMYAPNRPKTITNGPNIWGESINLNSPVSIHPLLCRFTHRRVDFTGIGAVAGGGYLLLPEGV